MQSPDVHRHELYYINSMQNGGMLLLVVVVVVVAVARVPLSPSAYNGNSSWVVVCAFCVRGIVENELSLSQPRMFLVDPQGVRRRRG